MVGNPARAVAFIPSDRQLQIRITLHRYVSPQIISRLDMKNLNILSKVLSPTMVKEMTTLSLLNPDFLTWLVTPDDYELQVEKLKMEALRALSEAVSISASDEDPKMWGIKIKAAEAILKQANNMSAPRLDMKSAVSVNVANIPKSLIGKSEEELQQELLQLQSTNKEENNGSMEFSVEETASV